jgi:hypothetical protein
VAGSVKANEPRTTVLGRHSPVQSIPLGLVVGRDKIRTGLVSITLSVGTKIAIVGAGLYTMNIPQRWLLLNFSQEGCFHLEPLVMDEGRRNDLEISFTSHYSQFG